MSNLLANLNAFKNKVKAAPVLSAQRRVSPANSTSTSSSSSSISTTNGSSVTQKSSAFKRSALESNDYSDDESAPKAKKPAYDTTGSHLSTKLLLAVEYIKGKSTAISVDTLLSYLSINNPEQRTKLLSLVKNLDKINYNEEDQTLEYATFNNIKTKQQLLEYLRIPGPFKGTSVKELKDGWTECLDIIKELEDEGNILVLKTKKDNQPRLIWANTAGKLGLVDEEFVTSWKSVKLPERAELPNLLKQKGLKPASVDPATVKNISDAASQKKRKARKGKITNTHMTGILKDYSISEPFLSEAKILYLESVDGPAKFKFVVKSSEMTNFLLLFLKEWDGSNGLKEIGNFFNSSNLKPLGTLINHISFLSLAPVDVNFLNFLTWW
ncbi:hypothetical protein WICPIJ_003165 [Wickerhamomyces pijperi]|uniref:TFIIE beta domain-containing protein n=1 Tax=Wickerhamomyces pijperi TaxID=599730 RepID=A0A9P8TNZ3_WICPI|nr:hypothetical protein WICPIJ_003165 [Wickerhamomyces pijperi]